MAHATPASVLKERIAKFTQEIDRQAAALVARDSAPAVARLAQALQPFGFEVAHPPALVEVWTDPDDRLVPKVIASLELTNGRQSLASRFDLPIGGFHVPGKADHIFELCMLRSEARHELEGEGDGRVIERMDGLQKELGF